MSTSSPPLSGLRVIDSASYVTGPYAAMILGDLGADVIKVEPPPKGDPMRNFGRKHEGTSLLWANTNRNKRSVMLDLKSSDGRDALLELARRSDVFISNWRAGVAEGLGVGDEVLAATNPRLVRTRITGFGRTGPMARRPAFDTLLQAASGFALHQGGGDRPALVRMNLVDKTTAMVVVQAVLAALWARERTGAGELIDLAMLDVIGWFAFPELMDTRTFIEAGIADDPPPTRSGFVETSDGYIVVAAVSGAQIGRACEACGHPEWKPQLRALADPRTLGDTFLDLIESQTRMGTTEEWTERFVAADVPVMAVLDRDEHLADLQVEANGSYVMVDGPLGRQRVPRYPARFSTSELPTAPLPLPGEHTEEVLAGLLTV